MSETGTVKKWMDGKGFGFITPADGGEDVFVHVKQVSGGEDLSEGDQVTFDKAWNDQKGKYTGLRMSLNGIGKLGDQLLANSSKISS